jgi:Bacterial regulatory helix-turn-helix protein, lysR family
MDTLTSINVFRQVVESGSLVGAAERLDLSTAMVSKHVMSIEKRLRVRLLNRNSHKLSLTEPGKLYFERCTGILQDLEKAEQEMESLSSAPCGTLRVACCDTCIPSLGLAGVLAVSPSLARGRAPACCRPFRAEHSRTGLRFYAGCDLTRQTLDSTRHGPDDGLVTAAYDGFDQGGLLRGQYLAADRIYNSPACDQNNAPVRSRFEGNHIHEHLSCRVSERGCCGHDHARQALG